MAITPEELRKGYESGELCGWLEKRQPGIAGVELRKAVSRGTIASRLRFTPFGTPVETAGQKSMLYQVVRKVRGQDTPNYPQEIGDCVSFGAKNGTEYLTCTSILLKKDNIKYRPVFPPYYYGTGRNYVGRNQLGGDDGSLGSWMAEAVQKYGTVFSDEEGCPKYSGSVAKRFGDSNARDDLDQWRDRAIEYPVQSAALIRSWEDLVAALVNGYPCPTASNIGYNMEPSSDGFHRQTTSWSHQMCFIGVDDNPSDPYAILLNSWGDAHGRLKDFTDSHDLPIGVLRIRRRDAEKHIFAGETYAYSQFKGFPEQRIDRALYDLM